MGKYFTAIIITEPHPKTGYTAYKRRNVPNTPAGLKAFYRHALSLHKPLHINFYDKETRKFIEQVKLDKQLVK